MEQACYCSSHCVSSMHSFCPPNACVEAREEEPVPEWAWWWLPALCGDTRLQRAWRARTWPCACSLKACGPGHPTAAMRVLMAWPPQYHPESRYFPEGPLDLFLLGPSGSHRWQVGCRLLALPQPPKPMGDVANAPACPAGPQPALCKQSPQNGMGLPDCTRPPVRRTHTAAPPSTAQCVPARQYFP